MNLNDIPTPIPGVGKSQWAKNRAQYEQQRKIRHAARTRKMKAAKVLATVQASLITSRREDTDEKPHFQRRRALVKAYRELLHDLRPMIFITFMPGYFLKPDSLRENIKKWCNRVERQTLKKKWNKCTRDRMTLLGFLEKPEDTPHYHALATMPWEMAELLEREGSAIWKTLMRRGKLDVQFIYEKRGVINYVTKDQHHHWADQNVFIYKPFVK